MVGSTSSAEASRASATTKTKRLNVSGPLMNKVYSRYSRICLSYKCHRIRITGSVKRQGIYAVTCRTSMASKAISLRLPEPMAAELAAIARTQDVAVSEVIREAVENYIVSRSRDKDFQQRLRKQLEEDREILERLT